MSGKRHFVHPAFSRLRGGISGQLGAYFITFTPVLSINEQQVLLMGVVLNFQSIGLHVRAGPNEFDSKLLIFD